MMNFCLLARACVRVSYVCWWKKKKGVGSGVGCVFQKALSGPVQKRPPQARAASHDLDERTILEGSNHSRRTDTANVLHLDAPDRLSVGDDGERLQSWSPESLILALALCSTSHPKWWQRNTQR